MGKKASAPYRRYTDEFKHEAVRLAESVGGTQAAVRLGIPESSLGNWLRLAREGKGVSEDTGGKKRRRPSSELEAENERLRRELANAKLDLDILKKAAAYFAKESR